MKNNNFFEMLKQNGIYVSLEQEKEITRRMNEVFTYEPRVGVFGKTGVGKSSLCNGLFGQDLCPISDVEACTRNSQEVLIGMGTEGKGIKLIDVPGVGESSKRDEEYSELYAQLLPELDLILWVLKADDRAMVSDEIFYKNIVKPHVEEGKPFFFVLNQVDKIEPFREWDEANRCPGPKQFQNIYSKVDAVAKFFNVAASSVLPISANEKYNLTKLVDEVIRALPAQKQVTVFRAVEEEFRSEVTGEYVEKSFIKYATEVVCKVLDVTGDLAIKVVDTVGDVMVATVETAGKVLTAGINAAKDWIRGTGSWWTFS